MIAGPGVVTYSIANRKALQLLPVLKASLPAGALDDTGRVQLLASVSALVKRNRAHRDDPDRLLQDAIHEVDKLVFADPSADKAAHVRALAACDWNHKTAIMTAIRAKLPDRLGSGKRPQKLDKKITKARCPPRVEWSNTVPTIANLTARWRRPLAFRRSVDA